ncbi:hypothetical protein [Nocardia cyriacigeorgica]|uniref:hypothetical protein n=1 Tax=Nocardia cyriacigeorgica TaxID=135487 RepID=UPI0024542B94|nr:hypothetical protein [Nocardia cyriacigeorgica]
MTTPRKPGARKRHGPSKGAASPDPDVMAKQQRCADLAVQGFTYTEIAEAEGYASESGARAAVHAVFRRAATESTEIIRPKLLARAEALWIKAYGLVLRAGETGDADELVKGLNAADKALARLSKLYGLDAPDVTVQIGASPGELEALKGELDALLSGQTPAIDAEVVDTDTSE